jgi:hypothetical protein
MRRSFVLAGIAVAVAAAVAVLLASRGNDSKPVAKSRPPAGQPVAVRVKPVEGNCRTRSEADFGRAFSDPGNLVVGPLAVVGGAEFTSPTTVRDVHGQKYPILLRAGHRTTIGVPPEARAYTLLGYGPLPQGEITLDVAHPSVTFVACARGEPSGSSAGGPVTFWSGSLVAYEPHCVPLDVFVDGGKTPRRVTVELGARCPVT